MTDIVAIIGAGSFGLGLASVLAGGEHGQVTVLGRNSPSFQQLVRTRENSHCLPGVTLGPGVALSCSPHILTMATTVILAVPSYANRDAVEQYAAYLKPGCSIVTCAKGFDPSTGKLLTALLEELLPLQNIAALSGPGFAGDLAKGLPTAMVIAAATKSQSDLLAKMLSRRTFRLYSSTDRIGVQVGGALKNVMAIGCGIVVGAGLGESAKAAVISRGLAELTRLVVAMKGDAATVGGLSGLGDLVLTSTSMQSRNYRFGIQLGRDNGSQTNESNLVEGVYAAGSATRLGEALGVDLPVTNAISSIISGRISVDEAVASLMSRPTRNE